MTRPPCKVSWCAALTDGIFTFCAVHELNSNLHPKEVESVEEWQCRKCSGTGDVKCGSCEVGKSVGCETCGGFGEVTCCECFGSGFG